MTPETYFYIGFIFGVLSIIAGYLLASKTTKKIKNAKAEKRAVKDLMSRKHGER